MTLENILCVPDTRNYLRGFLHLDEYLLLLQLNSNLRDTCGGVHASPAERAQVLDQFVLKPLLKYFGITDARLFMQEATQPTTIPFSETKAGVYSIKPAANKLRYFMDCLQKTFEPSIAFIQRRQDYLIAKMFRELGGTLQAPQAEENRRLVWQLASSGINALEKMKHPAIPVANMFPNIRSTFFPNPFPASLVVDILTFVGTSAGVHHHVSSAVRHVQGFIGRDLKTILGTNVHVVFMMNGNLQPQGPAIKFGTFLRRLYWTNKTYPGWVQALPSQEAAPFLLKFVHPHEALAAEEIYLYQARVVKQLRVMWRKQQRQHQPRKKAPKRKALATPRASTRRRVA